MSLFDGMTVPQLERVKRDLRASLGLLSPGSPAHAPILRELEQVDAALAAFGSLPAVQPGRQAG